jgi:hypothetical protein
MNMYRCPNERLSGHGLKVLLLWRRARTAGFSAYIAVFIVPFCRQIIVLNGNINNWQSPQRDAGERPVGFMVMYFGWDSI